MYQSAQKPFTIASGASLSDAIDVLGWDIVALEQPESCEGTTFTMQGSIDGGVTYADIQTDAAEWSVVKSATAAQIIAIPPAKRLRGFTHVKVRSGTSASATNQTGDAACSIGLAAPSGVQ
jgi:hypothetical protein